MTIPRSMYGKHYYIGVEDCPVAGCNRKASECVVHQNP